MNAIRIPLAFAAVAFLAWALYRAGRPVPQPPVDTRSRLSHPSMRAPITDDDLDRALDAWARAAGSGRLYDQEGEGL